MTIEQSYPEKQGNEALLKLKQLNQPRKPKGSPLVTFGDEGIDFENSEERVKRMFEPVDVKVAQIREGLFYVSPVENTEENRALIEKIAFAKFEDWDTTEHENVIKVLMEE